MKKIAIINIIAILGLIFFSTGCTEDWEEMNTDPNNPNEVPATNILAHSLRYFGDAFYDDWNNMNCFTSFAGHVTKIQYVDEARYEHRESTINFMWEDAYNLQIDQKKMSQIAMDQDKPKTNAVAETFSVFLWQMMTDTWKAIPYSEALSGEDGENTPVYDSQESIYGDLISRLEAANNAFNEPVNEANPDILGDGDVMYGGNFAQWQKFCNSIRLKIAMRISEVDPGTAQSLAETILGNPGNNPIMESNGDNAFLYWPGTAPYKEPWAENLETRDDHGMARTLVDTLKNLSDPRLPVYAETNPDGEYIGLVEGAVKGSFNLDTISRIGFRYRQDPQGFSPFMRYSETMFNVAEAALNGWNTGGWTAQAAYEAGVRGSLEENGVDEADINAYMAQPRVAWGGTEAENREKIYKQKWISLFKQGHEAWAFTRRTDFPAIDAAPGSPYPDHNRQPFRYPYPTQEKILNETEYSKISSDIVDNYWGQQMWWDTRSGVQ
jgi:hypothetical protein